MAGRRIRRALARITVAALALATPAVLAAPAHAVSEDLVISQVYGAGGNVGATYNADFVELFNRGPASVLLTGLSIQYASASGTGTFGQVVALSGTLQPGQYHLIGMSAGTNGSALPATDGSGTISMGAASGKVALVEGTTALACNGGSTACSAEQLARIVDLVGFGNANFFEGAGAAPTLSATTAAFRAGAGCTDTDDNAADFTSATPSPRNTATATNTCGAVTPDEPVINEFSASTTGTDVEYVEVLGSPVTDYSAYTVLELEGDSGSPIGVVDELITLGSTDANGLYLANLAANALENGTITLVLVKDFTGAMGDDLDTNDDGTLDVTPWSSIVDSVAVNDGGAGDVTYGAPVLGVSHDGQSFAPGGASRIPDGTDTDTAADWVRNDFDLAGIPGFDGTPAEGEALNTPGAPNALVEVEPPLPGTVKIHEVQGSGATTSFSGQTVTVEAVVTAVKAGLSGFYLQEEDADADANPETSEGIFVFGGATVGLVEVGQLVRVTGTVGEYTGTGSSQTQLSNATVEVLQSGVALPTAAPVTFPVPSTTYLERFEGMRAQLVDELVISEYFDYDRYGEVVLAKPLDGQDRLHTPTAVVEPGPAAIDLAAEQALRIITLDDYNSSQNPDPVPHPGNGEPFSATTNFFRGGDTVTRVVGVIDHTFGRFRIQPTTYGEYEAVNPRPTDAPDVGGSIQVASFNVLNYFLTIDQGPDVCGPLLNQDCRGADSQAEFDRQRAKTVEAIAELDADVVGLMEMENTSGVEPAEDLVEGLNDLVGSGTYAYIDTGVIGTDAIRLGFLYKPANVTPIGDYAILDSSVNASFDDTRNRPMLTQTFDEVATGARVTVSVNHLKSKGSACTGDPDTGDGQGNCNLTRVAAAKAIADFLASDPTDSGDPDHLVIGDLNSYDHEDPIDALVEAGYTDLVKKFGGEFAYGYVFDGKVGYLDHALSNDSLTPQVTGASEWHINADEPDVLDYNLDFGKPANSFNPDPYQSSDHDPVLVGLDLDAPGTVAADFGEDFLQCGADNATLMVAITSFDGADSHIVTVDWGDGTEPTVVGTDEDSVMLTHTYARAGTYTARVTVTDSHGHITRTTAEATVAYDTDGLGGPFKNGAWTAKNGSTVPVKAEFRDCDGTEPTDLDPTITVSQGGMEVFTATMSYVDGQWQYNLRTRDLDGPGEYTVTITVPETGQTVGGTLTVRR